MSKKIKNALVTGGSSGIGMEFSKLLIKDGYRVIIVAKPEEELKKAEKWFREHLPDADIIYHQQDLAIPGAAQDLYNFTSENGYTIDILINNAGFATFGQYSDIPIERELSMINLNVITIYHLTRLYLKEMVARNSGKILITSSTAALVPSPKMAAYAATKAFSFNYGMAVNDELKDLNSNVSITVLCPPSTRTGFQHTAGMDDLKLFDNKRLSKDPDFVAKKAYEALLKGKEMVIPGTFARILLQAFNKMARRKVVLRLMKLGKWGLK
ncbi:MAG: SDR family NAD(P)-dependent oxidoreductase [Promethearchaeota archaeon]